MDFLLDHRVVLNPAPKHRGLYDWALNELATQQIGEPQDWIPWTHRLHFRFADCRAEISVEQCIRDPLDTLLNTAPEPTHREARRIFSTLEPFDFSDGGTSDGPVYSMMGTNRTVSYISVQIYDRPGIEMPTCHAYSSPAYTDEDIDFRPVTIEDCIQFTLLLPTSSFNKVFEPLVNNQINEIKLTVGHVDGFYALWTPGSLDSVIKVLGTGEDPAIELPSGSPIVPLRTGEVGSFELNLNRQTKFAKLH
jgi:hypothetical protein